jgi:hypothetical protein
MTQQPVVFKVSSAIPSDESMRQDIQEAGVGKQGGEASA